MGGLKSANFERTYFMDGPLGYQFSELIKGWFPWSFRDMLTGVQVKFCTTYIG